MKVIGFTGNYGNGEESLQGYLMADSSILYSGRPFFLPDFAQRFVATPALVVRTGRLGKSIAPKFAHRYWNAFTAGFSVRAEDSDQPALSVLDRAFDGAAIVGVWVDTATVADALHETVELLIDGEVVARHCLADMRRPLDELLSGVSVRCSIKMGDLLFTGDAGPGHVLAPGNRLTALVGGKPVLDVKVRL